MNQETYKRCVRPFLFRMDPEWVHHLAISSLQISAKYPLLMRSMFGAPHLGRGCEVFGLKFPNVIGLAAGFDKNALAVPAWEAMGFGFVEVGTVTAKPQPGNPLPRLFRFPRQEAIINRMGFNNDGAEVVAQRLEKLRTSGHWPGIPVGMNLGKSRATPLEEARIDYLISFERMYELADYFVLNVSSPNTPGLRKLQDKAALNTLLEGVQAANRSKPVPKPLLVKIAPDLEFAQIEEVLELAEQHALAGIIATNTTLDHSSVPNGDSFEGGLSGRPLRERSTEIVRFVCGRTRVPVIGVGGIFDIESAKEKLDAGAVLIQLYTGFVFQGPGLVRDLAVAL